ncbi:LapA family protein [Priestia koreensis]|uniref:Lipopolysaccharide assembly protein A domain-containing protein n=1 Tax=Priestia koreensis TaxID=284581 RepID=A0A0M0LIE5_9BACI|nr:lipopolysaccharide assembly protein LapA domain-containing protein [Priestia koreensis]KOO50448.1 hypothetical protein AMD01_01445 [Priestia koreensis]
MKAQNYFILGLIFALIVAVLAVVNDDPVQFNYVFGSQDWPLILIILGAALFGGLAVGMLSAVKVIRLKNQVKALNRELAEQQKPVEPVEPSQPEPMIEKPKQDPRVPSNRVL